MTHPMRPEKIGREYRHQSGLANAHGDRETQLRELGLEFIQGELNSALRRILAQLVMF